MWQKLHNLFAKDDPTQSPIECDDDDDNNDHWPQSWADTHDPHRQDSSTRPLAVGLPRQATFRRQNSERRDRLLPIEPGHAERRALSSTRNVSTSLPRPRASSSPPHYCDHPARTSAPTVTGTSRAGAGPLDAHVDAISPPVDPTLANSSRDIWPQDDERPPRPPSTTSSDDSHYPQMSAADDKAELRNELDTRWILNLSMHFRDKSDREKFFVTYTENPSFWRRVTISCDYRNAEPGSLEMDLKDYPFQRDKSMQIYESIRDSLPEIQFYDTVTNLKLETTDGRLHVHVTEDVNEIIPYPARTTVGHILDDDDFRPMMVRESELTFDSHLSGFVYKVRYKDKDFIKKEIPGPDTVDEFLYEINALHALHGSNHVIQLEAIVLDDTETLVKGLLIGFAEKGAIVDLLYDHRGAIPWQDRCRWAEQAVRGLSEIHEEGYVQGDFTLSNIVVDGDGNAKIIDINRRGCPVGWEPPEIASKIASNQRISMYIGEKSDLYQLGMTLWALAMDDDEPERHVPPLSVEEFPSEVPKWYQDLVRICLSSRPRDRLSAKELVDLFPEEIPRSSEQPRPQKRPTLKVRTMKEYIDPANAVERDDIVRLRPNQQEIGGIPFSPESSRDDYTFTYPKSSNYEFDSETSGYDRPRGRRPPSNYAHLGSNERHHWLLDDERPTPIDDPEPNIVAISPGMERQFDEVDLDGHPYLIPRQTFNAEELEILERQAEIDDHTENRTHPHDDAAAEAMESLDSSRPLPVRRTSIQAAMSTTSDSTPRNSHATLPTLIRHQGFDPVTDADSTPRNSRAIVPILARDPGFDPIPEPQDPDDLERSDDHVDMDMAGEATHTAVAADCVDNSDFKASNTPEQRPRRASISSPPPSLPYADSGYDEPSHFVEHSDVIDTEAGPIEIEELGHKVDERTEPVAMTDPKDAAKVLEEMHDFIDQQTAALLPNGSSEEARTPTEAAPGFPRGNTTATQATISLPANPERSGGNTPEDISRVEAPVK